MRDAAHRPDVPRGGPAPIAAGVILAERFRLEQPLGAGGMAEVWRAFDLVAQRSVALKLLRPQVAGSAEAVQRLKREGEVLSALSHPAIVRVETYGHLEGGVVFLAMELLEGETLGARMRRGPMQPVELASIVAGTCAGLGAAHAKAIVHRDLKPDNIFLVAVPGSTEPQVKLLDFGISKVFGGDRLTYTGEILGTPRYMSPEQLGAETDIDPRVDIYALGVIVYEAIAGRPPFLASTPTDLIVAILHGKIASLRSLRPDVAPGLEATVSRAMARAREARYASAADFADAFLDAVGATSRGRALPKPKMLQTQALGGSGLVPASVLPPERGSTALLEPPPALAGTDADLLRPGTFSAFGAVDESAIRGTRVGPMGTVPLMPAVEIAPAPAPPVVAPPLVATTSPAPPGASESWREPSAVPWRDSEPPPTSSMLSRIGLVLAGLVAGALSAALAMAALHHWRASAPSVEPPREAPSVAPSPPPVVIEDERDEVSPTMREPTGADTPEVPEPAAPDEPSRRERSRRASSDSAPQTPTEATAEEVAPRLDPMEAAARALASGDAAACVAILDELITAGATPFALKRRADCLLRAGRRDDAIREYQRFCNVAPDHPAVGSVREQLAGMGLPCP